MNLIFTKMHGLGNDFVVIDAINQQFELTPQQARHIADRHFGIGCDQVLLVAASQQPNVDFRYRVLNADGSEVEQCGNGARCFARFVRDKGLTTKEVIMVETAGGIITLRMVGDGVQVDMGLPVLPPGRIPFDAPQQAASYPIEVAGQQLEIGAVSMGNPHGVLVVDDVARAPIETLGPLLQRHPRFPNQVNVGFMEVVDRGHIRLRVFERGAGETLACGSGACAAVVSGRIRNLLDENVKVDLPGGRLCIAWSGEGYPVMMTGPAETVFEGTINL